MAGERIKKNIDAAVGIATNSIEKSSRIVESAGEVLKGNVAQGVGGIVKSATDIATYATSSGIQIATQNMADAHHDVAEAADLVADRIDDRRK